MKKEQVTGRCKGCEHLTIINAVSPKWEFPACKLKNNKWCCEIKICPKEGKGNG